MLKVIIRILLLGIVIAMGAYIYLLKMPGMSVGNRDSDLLVTATAIATEFESDEAAADMKYKNKIMQIAGTLEESYEEDGQYIIIIKDDNGASAVLASMEPGQEAIISKYKENQPITVKGLYTGKLMEINLSKAVVVE